MSTRFGTYVGHSAKSIVLETQLESSNFSFFKLYAFILLTSTLVPGINYFVVCRDPGTSHTPIRRSSGNDTYSSLLVITINAGEGFFHSSASIFASSWRMCFQ